MKRIPHFLIFLVVIAWFIDAPAYEVQTHEDVLTRQAVERSVLQTNPAVLQDLGLTGGITDESQTFPDSNGDQRTIRGLLEIGSRFEDNVSPSEIRVTKHFFNPLSGQGLDVPLLPTQTASPDWALAPRGSNPAQQFSYGDARQYLYDALTKETRTDRDKNFGLLFQTLGQVVHHIQDMAQPQHVRNDVHCDKPVCIPLGVYAPSLFESWTNQPDVREVLRTRMTDPAAAGYDINGALFATTFNNPRKFWTTVQGQGLAQFTNWNFVSAGTNFDNPGAFNFPLFDPAKRVDIDIEDLCKTANPPCVNPNLKGKMTFYGNTVEDRYTGQKVLNPMASTESIFDAELTKAGKKPVFTLNRFNFDVAHGFLIPRAVAYSAGLINYFFRGRINFLKDPQGTNQYLIKNLGTEPMSGRFELYYDTADGARKTVTDRNGGDLVWETAQILVASKGILAAGAAMPVVADFVPPADAKNPDEYVLVFTGDMGEEKADANGVGAVAAKAIRAEPYTGALYLAGLDAQNRLVTLKTDTRGTRVLNGFDEKGVPHSTQSTFYAPGQIDIDPLHPVMLSFGNAVLPRVARVKQVAFEQTGLNGLTHRTVAISLARKGISDPMVYAWSPATNRIEFRGTTTLWTARSSDPAIGEFEFRPTIAVNQINGTLGFTRRYRDTDGVERSTSGTLPLPQFPAPAFAPVNANYVGYGGFQSGSLFIAPDGLTVSGLKIQSQDPDLKSFWDTYELSISLGGSPAVSLVRTEHVPLRTTTTLDPNNGTERWQTGPGTPPDQHWAFFDRSVLNSSSIEFSGRTFVDYLNGQLLSWRNEVQHVGLSESLSEARTDIVYEPKTGCPFTITTDRSGGEHRVSKNISTITATLSDGAIVSPSKSIPKGTSWLCQNCTHTFSFHQVDQHDCGGGTLLGTPATQDQTTFDPEAQDVRYSIISGSALGRALSGKVNDAITLPERSGFAFRGNPLGSEPTGFIAETSPSGEIFFATTDLRIVVHEPKPGGIPKVEIPSNVVKLLAALWL